MDIDLLQAQSSTTTKNINIINNNNNNRLTTPTFKIQPLQKTSPTIYTIDIEKPNHNQFLGPYNDKFKIKIEKNFYQQDQTVIGNQNEDLISKCFEMSKKSTQISTQLREEYERSLFLFHILNHFNQNPPTKNLDYQLPEKLVILVFDTETTGLEFEDQIIEITFINILNGDSFYGKVKPTVPLSSESYCAHGISLKELDNCLEWESLQGKLDSFFQQYIDHKIVIIAHNVTFDRYKLWKMVKDQVHCIPFDKIIFINSIEIFLSFGPFKKKDSEKDESMALSNLIEIFSPPSIEISQRHRSSYDKEKEKEKIYSHSLSTISSRRKDNTGSSFPVLFFWFFLRILLTSVIINMDFQRKNISVELISGFFS
ncbi:hypothetical protein DFA_03535 [Cavenderia fasciculata]|uniref:Exonuclease domain-containing protein n=1 Tax=Cavenderia fasciculata TaxID=261658 RepID=F4PHV2_CACFS|nr:uncharacterized protein DFA_03535 [Cavenderia fasciculata]EGG25286.1 hypothetical protein DFA_03535 [Cavenderia fasciculata]|eukprot:XP_004363137.1 hypothetical protein DFA_03535 [Cavenderia fasciculata]